MSWVFHPQYSDKTTFPFLTPQGVTIKIDTSDLKQQQKNQGTPIWETLTTISPVDINNPIPTGPWGYTRRAFQKGLSYFLVRENLHPYRYLLRALNGSLRDNYNRINTSPLTDQEAVEIQNSFKNLTEILITDRIGTDTKVWAITPRANLGSPEHAQFEHGHLGNISRKIVFSRKLIDNLEGTNDVHAKFGWGIMIIKVLIHEFAHHLIAMFRARTPGDFGLGDENWDIPQDPPGPEAGYFVEHLMLGGILTPMEDNKDCYKYAFKKLDPWGPGTWYKLKMIDPRVSRVFNSLDPDSVIKRFDDDDFDTWKKLKETPFLYKLKKKQKTQSKLLPIAPGSNGQEIPAPD